jgi:hypothetical protein
MNLPHAQTAWWPRLFAILATFSAIGAGKPLRLDVTRDTWVSALGKETEGNNGGSPRLKFKGIQELSIVDLDPALLRGKTITHAELHLKSASPDILHRVTISTLATDWTEGTGTNYEPQDGSACFAWATPLRASNPRRSEPFVV